MDLIHLLSDYSLPAQRSVGGLHDHGLFLLILWETTELLTTPMYLTPNAQGAIYPRKYKSMKFRVSFRMKQRAKKNYHCVAEELAGRRIVYTVTALSLSFCFTLTKLPMAICKLPLYRDIKHVVIIRNKMDPF